MVSYIGRLNNFKKILKQIKKMMLLFYLKINVFKSDQTIIINI